MTARPSSSAMPPVLTTALVQDIRVTPDLDAAYQNGSLAVNLDLKGSGKVDLELEFILVSCR